MNGFLAVIGIAVLAAVVFYIKKKSTESKLPETQGEKIADKAGKDSKPPLADIIKNALKDLKETIGSIVLLSYEETMRYFIEHKDDSPEIAKGALLKEDAEDGFKIVRVFLDKNNNIVGADKHGKPLGDIIRVKGLDSELLNLFKDNDLIILE